MVTRAALLVAGLVACTPAKPPEAPKPAGPTCAGAAAHMVDELAAGKDPRPADQTLNAMIALIRTRCEQDHWTPQAIACLDTMKTAADAERCSTLLTDEQQAALVRDQTSSSQPR